MLGRESHGSVLLSANKHAATILYAYRAKWGIPLRWLWPFLLGLLAALAAFRVLGEARGAAPHRATADHRS